MQTKRSAWTPLNHPLMNSKLFDERRQLLAKWFGSWSDSQRKTVLQDFVIRCSVEQLRFLSLTVSRRLPLQAADFTCLLPRALCLYLFSFLDPRSLCRCAQVSWHWKSIVELDQLWMAKCLRFGWCITFSPSAFEQGVWKRHYIETVQDLQRRLLEVSGLSYIHRQCHRSLKILQSSAVDKVKALPPWRDSDRHPKDTIRFNYLDNLDPVEQTFREKTPSEATYKLRKAKSLMFLRAQDSSPPAPTNRLPTDPRTQTRPLWASPVQDHPITIATAMNLLSMTRWNAGVRPGPVRTAVPQLSLEALKAAQRSQRSTPSKHLFEDI
uniref:F-box domain-containing protein n=1 Tax=Poecilia mexicana TaxID=48701 RepID=A0A3B3XCJ5_9TELE